MAFLQNKFPKVLKDTYQPANWPANPALEWNPPGHGDIYLSLYASGMLDRLLGQGIRYAFISNADNLGAAPDPALLGYFAGRQLVFMMEVALRTASDAKGGHLARLPDSRLVLREVAQCHPNDAAAFQDIKTHRYFNTNSIWVDLQYLKDLMDREGLLSLPMIVNPKTVDPTDANSPQIYQIETAMGAAISIFDNATAVCVPRNRFIPVKSTSDLLAVRSDRYQLQPGMRLTHSANAPSSVHIDLDSRFFKRVDQFEDRFRKGMPSLQECRSLVVEGDVYFSKMVEIRGDVKLINNSSEPVEIPEGTIVEDEVLLLA